MLGRDEAALTLFQVLDVAARQGDADFVDFGSGDSTCCIVFLVLSDVTHSRLVFWRGNESEGDWRKRMNGVNSDDEEQTHLRFCCQR